MNRMADDPDRPTCQERDMSIVEWCLIEPDGGIATTEQYVLRDGQYHTVTVPLFLCVECDEQPATWFIYRYDNAADQQAGEFRSCAWVCEDCQPAVLAQCTECGCRVAQPPMPPAD